MNPWYFCFIVSITLSIVAFFLGEHLLSIISLALGTIAMLFKQLNEMSRELKQVKESIRRNEK